MITIENKKPTGMKGIINSALDPVDETLGRAIPPAADRAAIRAKHEQELASRLLDAPYLGALLQKAFFNEHDYDPESERWENVTPKQYRDAMNSALRKMEELVEAAWEAADVEFNLGLNRSCNPVNEDQK